MKLYYHPLSTYSQKVTIALHEKQIDFETEEVMLMDPEARERYRAIYPLGKIPLLVNGDEHVPESSVIVEYLDQRFPDSVRLIPTEVELSRRTRAMDRVMDLYLDANVATLLFQSWKPEAQREPELIDKARFQIGVSYDHMARQLANGPWLMGERFTLADIAAAPALFYAGDVAPFADRPLIGAYWQRLAERPSVAHAIAAATPHLEMMAKAREAAA